MKTKYYLLRAFFNFKKNFLKYLSITSITTIVLLVFYVISISILATGNLFYSLGGYMIFVITAVILCLLLNPILEAYVFAVDVTRDIEDKKVPTDTKGLEPVFGTSYLKSFKFGIKHKLRMQNRGSVRIFKNILRSVLIYLILFSICELITMAVLYYTNEEIFEMYNTYLFAEYTSSVDLELLSEYISTPLLISNFLSLLFAFLSYFYFLFTYLFKSSLGNSYYMILKSNRVANIDETYKANKSKFLKPYWAILGYILAIFSIVFTTSYFLLYFYTDNMNLVFITETSLFIGILVMTLFIPALFELYKGLKITFNVYFLMNFIPFIEQYLKNLSRESYDSSEDKERVEFIRKLYKNDLNQVISFGNLYYLQLVIEYDLFKNDEDIVDEKEMERIKNFMSTNPTIIEVLGAKEETN